MPVARAAAILATPALLLSAAVVARAGQPIAASPADAASPAQAAAELRGQRVFIRCASCHAVTATAPTKVGPNLHGVIGRRAGSLPGYAYSPAMRSANLDWTEAMLDKWLTRPSSVVPGTSMAFAGLASAEDRKAVIAYLRKAGR